MQSQQVPGQPSDAKKANLSQGPGSAQASQAASQAVISATSLGNYASFDLPTDLEIEMWQHWKEFVTIVSQTGTQSDRVNHLQRSVSSSNEQHSKIISGMVFGILISPQTLKGFGGRGQPAQKLMPAEVIFADMQSVVRDHFQLTVYFLVQLTRHNFTELKTETLERIVWLTENLISKAVPNLKDLVLILLQQISVSRKNAKSFVLNRQLADILHRNIDWVCTQQDRFPSIVFLRFMRQAEEHYGGHSAGGNTLNEIEKLRDIELSLCFRIWQHNKVECCEIGREFVRIFSNVAKYKILEPIKVELAKEIKGRPLLIHLLENRGHKAGEQNMFVAHMLTLEVQRKLEFMLTQLPEPNMYMYSKWLFDFAGIEFGTESESILTDMVRFIIVNVTPTNEIIRSDVCQRWQLISHLVTQQKHPVHQSWVLQALFLDWLYYDENSQDSIMLVEPAMLLMYRSTEKRSWITDMLVEFLDNYVRNYDPSRVNESLRSVQRVLRDCERKCVVGSILRDMINNPKLKPQTQMILKEMYCASERQKARQQASSAADAAPENQTGLDYGQSIYSSATRGDTAQSGLCDPYTQSSVDKPNIGVKDESAGQQDAYDYEMLNDAGQFSPPYQTAAEDAAAEENSAFIAETQPFTAWGNQNYDPSDVQSPSYSREDSNSEQDAQRKSSNDGEEERKKPQKQAATNKRKDQVVSDSSDNEDDGEENEDRSGSDSSSSSSDDEDDEEPAESNQQIQVPTSVINRFFTNRDSLTSYLQKRTKESTFAMLDDMCTSFQIKDGDSVEELTELSYILFESMKTSLVVTDMLKLSGKWRDVPYTHIFRYLRECVVTQKAQHFFKVAHLIRSIAQFDSFFEVKLVNHFLLEGTQDTLRSSQEEAKQSTIGISINCIAIQKYAETVYKLPGVHSASSKQNVFHGGQSIDFVFSPHSLVAVKNLITTQVISKVTKSCQFKYLNWFMIAFVDLMPSYAVDNEQYLQTFLTFAVPTTQSKMISQIRLQHISLFEFGLTKALKNVPETYMGQRCLWSLLTACCGASLTNFKQREPLSLAVSSALLELIRNHKDEANVQTLIAGTIVGIQEFLHVLLLQADYKLIQLSFWSFLDLYHSIETLDNEFLLASCTAKEFKTKEDSEKFQRQQKEKIQKQLRPVLREVAQIVLATFFQVGSSDTHSKLLESVIEECVLVSRTDTSTQVKAAAFCRLKVTKDIFSSKLSLKTIQTSGLHKTVQRIKGFNQASAEAQQA